MLWCNPPFSLFETVVRKVAEDKAECILIIPDWPTKRYWRDVRQMKKAEVYYPPVTQVFELDTAVGPVGLLAGRVSGGPPDRGVAAT